ncbi:MAG: polymerase sigma factor SigK, partial [Chthoniobacteraceae bacterium]|nr:polymerase sigma factor SigK [Chthoniobacteraceae bacterium]
MNIEKLRTLWDEHAKAVYAYLLHLTRNEADASDFLQDLFSRLARQPELLDKLHGEPRGYLLRLARNAVVDQVRRHQARERVFEKINALRPAEFAEAEDPDNPLLRDALADALAQLPLEQRTVAHARLWKKQTLETISSELGISINTAASRYRYALDKMRERLRYLYEDLVPSAVQKAIPAMNQKPRNPFHRFEEPIIQPLEARRVPSATGAGFALPILPMPDDHSHEEGLEHSMEHPAETEGDHIEEIEPLFDGHDPHFDDAHLEAFLHIDTTNVHLPITFDHVMQTLGKESAPAASSGPDIVWAMETLQPTNAQIQLIHNQILLNPADDGHVSDQPIITGTVLTGNGGSLLSSFNLTVNNTASFTLATVNDAGKLTVVVANHESDPAPEPIPASDTVAEHTDLKTTVPETPEDTTESSTGAPHSEHIVVATHETVATPVIDHPTVLSKDVTVKPGVQVTDFHQIEHPENTHSETAPPVVHEVDLPEPATDVSWHAHSEHPIVSLDLDPAPNPVEQHPADFAQHPVTVDQWVPVHDEPADAIPDDLGNHRIEPIELQLEKHPLDIADTGAWTTPPVRGSAIAMAATGS